MVEFGEKYTAAWNSKKPDKMASFYAEDGILTVNNGAPAQGRKQLSETAKSYMEAFPEMKLTMDSLVVDSDTYRYHWTFLGTNSGPGGTTGNKVIFSGFERWTMNNEGLIQESIGTYDAEDVNGTTGDWLFMGFKDLTGSPVGSAIFISDISRREGEAWYLIDQPDQPFFYLSPSCLYLKPLTLHREEEFHLNYRILHIAGDVTQ